MSTFMSCLHAFFYKQHFYKQRQAETGKKLVKAKQHPEAEYSPFDNYSLSSSTLSFKNNRRYSKKCTKTGAPVLMTLKYYWQ